MGTSPMNSSLKSWNSRAKLSEVALRERRLERGDRRYGIEGGGESENNLDVSAEWGDSTKGGVGERGSERTWFGKGEGNWKGGGGDGTLILELLDWLLSFRGARSRRYSA